MVCSVLMLKHIYSCSKPKYIPTSNRNKKRSKGRKCKQGIDPDMYGRNYIHRYYH